MINARSLATLGVGFGVMAMATLGVVTQTQPQNQPASVIITTAWPAISTTAAAASAVTSAVWQAFNTTAQPATIQTAAIWPAINTAAAYPTIEVTRELY